MSAMRMRKHPVATEIAAGLRDSRTALVLNVDV